MKRRTYDTPAAFKRALEDRLKAASTSGVDFARRRQLLVFDRFLARMVVAFGEAVMLKGGLVLELRLERARTMKDVDLRLAGSGDDILERLQAAGALDLGDFMRFEVAPDPDTPEIGGDDGVQYDGYRFRAECRLAGKVYGARFGVDVALGGVLSGDVEEITADDLLGFAGIAPPKLRVVPVETHLAEKLHAYTMPRDRPNTRVKDLPDLALLGTIRPLEAARVREAIEGTFGSRRVHPVPARLPSPPEAWTAPYARMAEQNALPWRTLAEAEAAVRAFLDPLLSSARDARWDPGVWAWSA
ncbi:MAG TPA: nucleotidyl transferase AbiEii/AbiGii toxin family protein [Anaeromyxobacteraceae bacterium]|nr:nucleotidyl transferase AbiEii/AbiGii toxin family protein [Anaeromyxobacteraceae bacterium]